MIKGFFSGESLFLIKCSGQGDLWFNTFGALFEIEVDGEYLIDTGHIVAFTEVPSITQFLKLVATSLYFLAAKVLSADLKEKEKSEGKQEKLVPLLIGFILLDPLNRVTLGLAPNKNKRFKVIKSCKKILILDKDLELVESLKELFQGEHIFDFRSQDQNLRSDIFNLGEDLKDLSIISKSTQIKEFKFLKKP